MRTFPLSNIQLRQLPTELQNPGTAMYLISSIYHFPLEDKPYLVAAIEAALSPNFHLRLTQTEEGEYAQYIGEPRPIRQIDLSQASAEEIKAFIKTESNHPFPGIFDQPLTRFILIQEADRMTLLYLTHHIIGDGTSNLIFHQRIKQNIEALKAGNPCLPVRENSYEEFVNHEREYLTTQQAAEDRAYWINTLSDLDNYPDPEPVDDIQSGNYYLTFSPEESKQMRTLCDRFPKPITPFILTTSLFAVYLARFKRAAGAVLAVGTNSRPESSKDSCGMYVNMFPMKCPYTPDKNVCDYLAETKEILKEGLRHSLYPFNLYAEELVKMNIDPASLISYSITSNADTDFIASDQSALPLEIHVNAGSSDRNGLQCILFRYVSSLFPGDTIQRMAASLKTLLLDAAAHPGKTCAELELLTPEELQRLDSFNANRVPYDQSQSIVSLFRHQVAQTPEQVAVVYKDKKYTYREVDELSERIGQYIKQAGLQKEQVVSILIPRCEYMAIASIGVLKAGCAYQPLDPSYPTERLNFMVQDANTQLLIADESLVPLISEYKGNVLSLNEIPTLPDTGQRLEDAQPEDLLILLYTSGSTGVPKGCMLEHRNLVTFCNWYKSYYNLTADDKVAAYASYGFDADMMDLYPALTNGATVHIIEEDIRLDLLALNAYFETNGITLSFITTQVGRQFALNVNNHSLRHLSVGGEKLVPMAPPANYPLHNLYGPTECTVLVTAYQLKEQEANIPIGKALQNVSLYIVDTQGRRVPVGAAGELWIAGPQVTRGYLNRPEQTHQAYIVNPFTQEKGYERIYRSGDIVRYRPDGNIEFVGRKDGQVKIRGFRIELTEVEGIIREFPCIQDATVATFDEAGGGKYIAAYIVSDEPIDIEALHRFILDNKPPYMVPAITMQIDQIPLNQNQKVNKKALPVPVREAEVLVSPQNETQQKIFDLVADVIGNRDFGVSSNLYMFGLTSIGAIKLNVVLAKAFNKTIKNKDLKENNTIQKLEVFLTQDTGKPEETFELQEDYPLTQTQMGIYIESIANEHTTIYNIPLLFKLGERVDIERLENAIRQTVDAHPSLKRQLFINPEGEIRQKRLDNAACLIQRVHKTDAELDKGKALLVEPYQMLDGPLFRIELIQTPTARYLFIDTHHIISDGTSVAILLNDINRAYDGKPLEMESYTGFEAALSEERSRRSEEYTLAKNYYDHLFKGIDTDYLLPKDHKDDKQPGKGIYTYSEPTPSVEEVNRYCMANGITMNAFFVAAFGYLIATYNYKEEAVFTTIYNGRNDSRLVNTVNMLVKTLPVYCKPDPAASIKSYIQTTRQQLEDSMAYDIYSFAEISNAYHLKADIMIAFQGDNFMFNKLAGDTTESIALTPDTAKSPISLDITIEDNRFIYQMEYRSDLYKEETMKGMVDSLHQIADEFLKKQTLKEVEMTSVEALEKVMSFNRTEAEIEDVVAPVLLERQVEKHLDKIAVIADGKRLTFAELNASANRIAHGLLKQGIQIEQFVGAMMPRTIDAYPVRQGIMKAGGAFLPIDPQYPDDRISYIMENSAAPFLITTREIADERTELLQTLPCTVLTIDQLALTPECHNPEVAITPDNLAYCIYTSGSTGKPKGVMICHRNLVNYVDNNPFNTEACSYIRNATVSLAFAALTFDVSILEECIPLYHGITVCMATEDEIHNPLALSKLILDNGVDVLTCTPSFLSNIIDMMEMRHALRQIKEFNVGAESFPASLYDKIRALDTKAEIFNGYGPTETCIGCTFEQVTGDKITIGRPMGNMKMVMVDKQGHILPVGVPGEMIILGRGVGRGYVGLPDKTAASFFTLSGLPAYHSGDLARWNLEGKIEFMGRLDNQVKLRGLRIELDEIENAINAFKEVTQSVVVVRGKETDQFLCAYYTAKSPVDNQELKAFILQSLTEYMVPDVLIQLPAFPLTSNGKVDKKALPEPTREQAEKGIGFTAPETELQKQLCAIFGESLGLEKVSIYDNFFEIGGTSLSASKVAMKCMTQHLPIVYADLFKYKRVVALEAFIEGKRVVSQIAAETNAVETHANPATQEKALQANTNAQLGEIKQEELGDVLLTGSTGFLGIHLLRELLETTDSRIYCLVRQSDDQPIEERLKSMLFYYFENSYDSLFGTRIIPVEGEITEARTVEALLSYPFETLINSAACVKHFVADNTLEKVNVEGVKNLIGICLRSGRRLIQISTTSVGGDNVNDKFPKERRLRENELYFGQDISNAYVKSKFDAEEAMVKAIEEGLRGKIMRVGNLMGRASDGEFQINFVSNGFMRMLLGYSTIGKYPVTMMDAPAEFSPIDATAQSIIKLSSTPDPFTLFHAYNCHFVHMADVIKEMNECGIKIDIVSEEEFQQTLATTMNDAEKSLKIAGLFSYMADEGENKKVMIDADNQFTIRALYRLNYKWPLTGESYLKKCIIALQGLNFFDV